MTYIGGPLPAKRRLPKDVENSIMLYGSEIWVGALDVKMWLKFEVTILKIIFKMASSNINLTLKVSFIRTEIAATHPAQPYL